MVTYRTPGYGRMESETFDINRIRAMRIALASPERIREWSHGEVKNPETIDYKTHKPKMDGLFCERIFGPTKDYECACGKYKGSKHKNVVCDRCGVEVIPARARRARLGHIELQMPVAHIWFTKGVPSRMAILLDITLRSLEKVIYYEEFIVVDPGDTPLKVGQLLSEAEYVDAREQYGTAFKASMGAEAVGEVLRSLNLDELSAQLKQTIATDRSQQRVKKAIKRLKVVEDFRSSRNDPAWMILEVLPVIPPDLRPLVPLDGGRFATSDLNDLYRRVINRNNRLRRLKEVRAPEVIIRNEKRMLQEAVDALLDNGRRGRPVKGSNNRPLKSLSDMLKGKQGRFRQNLLGKRVDYSGRSVIVVGPQLKFHQCGLPKKMALELFEPFIIRRLEEMDDVNTIRSAKRKIEREDPEVFAVLEEVIKDHPVLLNRAPTLHRLGIQAFQPVLVEGKAIQLHPLVCTAFNADFDGDQMAVHVPLSREARAEARQIMLSTRNILAPSDGKPLATPTQDIVLGCYYLTKVRMSPNVVDEQGVEHPPQPRRFANPAEAVAAYDNGVIGLQEEIEVRIPDDPDLDVPLTHVRLGGKPSQRVRTTVGRIIFNECLPPQLGFVNRLMTKKALADIVLQAYRECGEERTARFLDELKDLGFQYAKIAGVSMSLADMIVPPEKSEIIAQAREAVNSIQRLFETGAITNVERYKKTCETWINATERVAEVMMQHLAVHAQGFNPIYIMADSGARGSKDQIKQLTGMRGLMQRPTKKLTGAIGETIETPIEANFKEGLTVLEYFISTHGARKGLADTALKTAEAGYLTRRLVDVAQDIIVTDYDCGTVSGMDVRAIKGEQVIESLYDRIVGRVVQEDVRSPLTNELIVRTGDVIDEEVAAAIERCGIESVRVRSVMSCEASRGVCSKCYGWDMTRRKLVLPGEAVGVMAAQSIGEPGTQLTLRTFHMGGTASTIVEQSNAQIARAGENDPRGLQEGEIGLLRYIGLRCGTNREGRLVALAQGARPLLSRSGFKVTQLAGDEQGRVVLENIEWALASDCPRRVTNNGGAIHIRNAKGKIVQSFHNLHRGAKLLVEHGAKVSQGDEVAVWDPYTEPTLAGVAGVVRLLDVIEGKTVAVDEEGQRIIQASATLRPRAVIESSGGSTEIVLVPGQILLVADGAKVEAGDVVARLRVPVLATSEGKCRFYDLIDGTTVVRKLDPLTRVLVSVVTDHSQEYRPRIVIVNRRGETQSEHYLPPGAYLTVDDGEDVFEGHILARTAKVVQMFTELKAGIPVGAEIVMPENTRVERIKGNIAMVTESGRRVVQSEVVRWDTHNRSEVAGIAGVVKYQEIVAGVTMRVSRESGAEGGQKVIMEHREDRHPAIVVKGANGEEEYHSLPTGANITVDNGQQVQPGDVLAKIPRETFKSRDVTGGLPRVEEIFEARRPKLRDLALIAKLDGYVLLPNEEQQKALEDQIVAKLGRRHRKGTRLLLITNREATEVYTGYEIETSRYIIVTNGDFVARGDKLVDGSIDPHEYLEVMGEKKTQEWLLNEVQQVYRMQGVNINDKHIEVIVRQMLRKVIITDAGDTRFLIEDLVDKQALSEENARVEAEGGKPAKFQARLLGITKASLGTESFISAASFQETTRVLTQAAVAGREDRLLGLKENVIMGHLIPAGTGKPEYMRLRLDLESEERTGARGESARDEARGLEDPVLPA